MRPLENNGANYIRWEVEEIVRREDLYDSENALTP